MMMHCGSHCRRRLSARPDAPDHNNDDDDVGGGGGGLGQCNGMRATGGITGALADQGRQGEALERREHEEQKDEKEGSEFGRSRLKITSSFLITCTVFFIKRAREESSRQREREGEQMLLLLLL